MTIEKIIIGIFLLNGLINFLLIYFESRRYRNETGSNISDAMFFRAYIYLVPFFLTRQILAEIEEKNNMKVNPPRKNNKSKNNKHSSQQRV